MIATYSPILMFLGLLGLLGLLAKKGMGFNKQVLFALILGVSFGGLLHWLQSTCDPTLRMPLEGWLQLVGDGYLSLLKMLVIPLILTSIIQSILRLGDKRNQLLGKLAFRSVGMLLLMTAVASAIGIGVANIFKIGAGLTLDYTVEPAHPYTGLAQTLLAMIPSNPVALMHEGNTIAIAIFAVLIGISAQWLRQTDNSMVEPFARFMESFFLVIKKLTQLVIMLTPYAILALMTQLSLHQGVQTLMAIFDFVLAIYIAMALVILMHLMFISISGMNPILFLRKVYPAILVAFFTRSSFGTLPISEEVLRNKLQVRQITASFVPSIGATVGMNACAGVFPAMLVMMAMTILHLPVTIGTVISIMLINMIASLGISGIPGTASIAASVSLTTLGLPYAVIGLVQGVDSIVDMGRTATNVHGVLTTAYVVDKSLPHTPLEKSST